MVNKIFLTLLILLLSSCYINWYKPHGHIFTEMPEGGSPGFELGWIHGCQSGLGTQFGSSIYITAYSWSRDIDITSVNPNIERIKARYPERLKKVNWADIKDVKKNLSDYNTIFWAAHAFCRHSTLGLLQNVGLEPDLAGGQRWKPEQHSIGAVWKLTGKGDTRIGAGGNSSLW
jgi:hypothetical protein